MNLWKRLRPQFAILLIICLIISFGLIRKSIIQTKGSLFYSPTIIIDPGHGGFDGGAVANDGTVEKNINLAISFKLKKILEFNGYNVIMTRTEDIGTDDIDGAIASRKKSDLQNRLELMNKHPDALYISIHLNKFTTSAASGTQVFYTENFDEAKALGQCIQSSVVKLLQPENTRVIKQGTSSTFLLHKAQIPAVIVECGFISNTAELKLLKTEKYQSQMAFAVASGIIKYKG